MVDRKHQLQSRRESTVVTLDHHGSVVSVRSRRGSAGSSCRVDANVSRTSSGCLSRSSRASSLLYTLETETPDQDKRKT
eukprot:8746462-Pyramimonas_sp.AAC.1